MRVTIIPLLILLFCGNVYSNNQYNYPAFVYKGYILTNTNHRIEINFNFFIANDFTITGLYYYNPENGSLNISGKVGRNNSIDLVETTADGKITGSFTGSFTDDKSAMIGVWKSPANKSYFFSLKHIPNHSYRGYINEFSNLKEYKDLSEALREPAKVERLNLSDPLPKNIGVQVLKMKNMSSVVFIADKLKKFPAQLTMMPRLEEVSLASNHLTKIPPEIYRLQNLRVLIVDFNHLNSLPKKIGELHNLLYLDISGNNISNLPDEISNLYQLQELHAESNSFSEVEMVRIRKLLPNCVVYF